MPGAGGTELEGGRVSALAERDTFVKSLGIELVEAGPGRAVTRLAVAERHLNFNGVCQGGLTFTLADAAFGYACNSHGVVAGAIDAHMTRQDGPRVAAFTGTAYITGKPTG